MSTNATKIDIWHKDFFRFFPVSPPVSDEFILYTISRRSNGSAPEIRKAKHLPGKGQLAVER